MKIYDLRLSNGEIFYSSGTNAELKLVSSSTAGLTFSNIAENFNTLNNNLVPSTLAVYNHVNEVLGKVVPFTNDSYALGTSIMNGFGLLSPPSNSFFTMISNYLNITTTNLSESATGCRRAYQLFSLNKVDGTLYPLISDAYFNNVRVLTGKLNRYKTALAGTRALASLNWTKNTYFIYSGTIASTLNPNVTLSNSSGWAIANSGSGAGSLSDFSSRAIWFRANVSSQSQCNMAIKNSVIANETLTFTNLTGSSITIATYGVDGVSNNWSRIEYSVDGVILGTYDPNGLSYLGFPDGGTTDGIMPDAIIIAGLTNKTHTLVLKFLDNGKKTAIDYVGILHTPYVSQSAPVYVMDAYHMSTAGYATVGYVTTEEILDDATEYIRTELIKSFPSYTFGFVPTNSIYNPSDSTQVQADGVHPTIIGQKYLYDTLINMFSHGFVNLNTSMNYIPVVGTSNTLKNSILQSGTDYTLLNALNAQYIISDGTQNAAFFTQYQDSAFYGINRNPSTGNIFNPSKSTAVYAINSSNTGSNHQWYVSTSANTTPTLAMMLDSNSNLILNNGSINVSNFYSTQNYSFFGTFNQSMNLGVNRNPVTGNISNVNYGCAQYSAMGDSTGGYHDWYTSNTTNTVPVKSASLDVNGNFSLNLVGSGLKIKEGTNATMGRGTLINGVLTINTNKVTTNCEIFITVQSLGTVSVPTTLAITSKINNTSFTVTSASLTDTSTFSWLIIEPS